MPTIAVPPADPKRPFWRRALARCVGELTHVLPPTLFFFIGFNVLAWTKRMFLQEQHI